MVLTMRKRRQRPPAPKPNALGDRVKVVSNVLKSVFVTFKLAEWVWQRWPF